MLLNAIEKALMNNPFREALQRGFEAPRLLAMGGPIHGGRALEIGCGRGVGVELILDVFGAQSVDAFDLDPDMVARARQRLNARGDRVRLWTGDAEHIDAPDGVYDAVFDFGILHHVPDWRRAIAEVYRVLRPGGRFYGEDVLAHLLNSPVVRRAFAHPLADRFDRATLLAALRDAGFTIAAERELRGRVLWFIAERPQAPTLH